MRQFLSKFIISLLLLGSGESISSDCFDFECLSDSIVGKLWNGVDVPLSDIEDLFKAVQHLENNKEYNSDNDNIINEWKESMIQFLKITQPHKYTKEIENINNITNNVNKLKNKFPPTTIEQSLSLILQKY